MLQNFKYTLLKTANQINYLQITKFLIHKKVF